MSSGHVKGSTVELLEPRVAPTPWYERADGWLTKERKRAGRTDVGTGQHRVKMRDVAFGCHRDGVSRSLGFPCHHAGRHETPQHAGAFLLCSQSIAARRGREEATGGGRRSTTPQTNARHLCTLPVSDSQQP
ncbi:hypothetical protein TPAR_06941 [Tolypocladium paradoxum]|uniref:Uncharacterized protein n=1 Tax=Tolypocladium paradoxum TaxID=94208 RepID=A0A2S4KRN9_9HYPO|nr:hypothetical protein TPAR_06941 [Tolypocladium paradoxum]